MFKKNPNVMLLYRLYVLYEKNLICNLPKTNSVLVELKKGVIDIGD